ncbi:MAG: YajQ family cyclic di-GMP-binding protein [Deltaproteobacteria bacterium]|nr:YajQ family cyclic di-GMP-binding protein [Deltaproteobacteria bacterium]
MPSFDVVSKVDLMEVENAVNVAQKEVTTRYDFRGTNTTFEQTKEAIIVRTSDEMHLKSALQVLRERFAKRGLPARCLEEEPVEQASGQSLRQNLKIKQGIEKEAAKLMVKDLKESKLKVQTQIQGDELRITGKNRDDLQTAIAFLRRQDYKVDLQFENFRD